MTLKVKCGISFTSIPKPNWQKNDVFKQVCWTLVYLSLVSQTDSASLKLTGCTRFGGWIALIKILLPYYEGTHFILDPTKQISQI